MLPLRDINRSRSFPLAVWLIIVGCVVVFFQQVMMPTRVEMRFLYLFGLVPRRLYDAEWAWRVGFPPGATLSILTSMFLHGSFAHLLFNMWTLAVFGDNVEDRMGHFRFILFYLLCGIAAAMTHVITNPSSTIPTVGASGAIAGVLAAYLFLFPHARIVTFIPVLFIPYLIEMPAALFLGMWFLIQLLSGWASLGLPPNIGGVAWWAHIGGFVFGALTFSVFLRRNSRGR